MYIPELESQVRNLFFIRPRRFGKSVFLNMLHAYYDIRTKDKFQQWFGDLWIGKHPTPNQGRYQVLHLDFSQVGGTIEELEEKFNFYLGMRLDGFINAYAEYYSEETIQKVKSTDYAGGKLGLIQQEAQFKGYPLYLVTLDDVTSGFNIGWHISTKEEFNQMLGFSTEDVRELFTYYQKQGKSWTQTPKRIITR